MIMSSIKFPQISSLGGTTQIMCLPTIERIYPKASELSEILNYNPCPECSEVFLNTPNLEMHLQKCHGHEAARPQQSKDNVFKQYYCPEVGCKYSGNFTKEYGIKYFTQHKYLKQHYIKVHMEKKFVCEQCDKGFATVQLHKRHLEVCGHKFTCSCGAEYKTVPALLTHASRKKHTFIKSWTGIRNRKVEKNENVSVYKQSETKLCDSVVANTAVALSGLSCQKSVDVGVQTEPTPGQRRRRNVVKSPDTSRQTQTVEKRTRISSETQTVGDYCNRAKKNMHRRRKKSMETQTKVVEQTVVSDESYFSSQDVGLSQLWLSSGTQKSSDPLLDNTVLELSSPLFDEEIVKSSDQNNIFNDLNTDSTDQFLKSFLEKDNFEDDGKSCSIETQTEFSFESLFENYTDTLATIETQTSHDMWDQYNNTCTQTCDDILLAFTDIETQTAWTDICTDKQTTLH